MSYLSYNDLIEASVVCKRFYHLSRKNSGFGKKLIDSRTLFSSVNLYEQYKDACLSFAAQIHFGLKKTFDDEDLLLRAKDIILKNLFFDILPSRVWNHMWYCSRSYYCSSLCLYCTRVCINHRGVSDLVNNKRYV